MKILGVDTTRKNAFVALIVDEKVSIKTLKEGEKQSENFMFYVDNILAENNVKLTDIDVFAVCLGAGSFTGIRVGLATIKAFAYALKKPVVSCNTFEVVADTVKNGVILLESTSSTLYYGEIKNSKLKNAGVIEKSALSTIKNAQFILKEEHLLGCEAYTFNVLTDYPNMYAKLILNLAKNKKYDTKLEPYYLQLSQAERNLEKKHD